MTIWIKSTVQLSWRRCPDGYAIDDSQREPLLVPVSPAVDYYRITLGETEIVRDLANVGYWPEGARAFANKWGLLNLKNAAEPADHISNASSGIRVMLGSTGIKAAEIVGSLEFEEAQLTFERGDDLPQIRFYADDLYDFCRLEAFYAIMAEKTSMQHCSVCQKAFVRRANSGREPDVCSSGCRQKKHRTAHRDAINRARRTKRAKARRSA